MFWDSGCALGFASASRDFNEAFAHGRGFGDESGGDFRAEDFGGGLAPELDPAAEVLVIHLRDSEVRHHGIALVASGGEQDRGPEVGERGEVLGPVVSDGVVEDRAKQGVFAYTRVEAVHERSDGGLAEGSTRHDSWM